MNYAAFPTPSPIESSVPSNRITDDVDAARRLSASSLRVLLVEDLPEYQREACNLLISWGIVPDVASNGAKAVRFCQRQTFDLILMDINMPVMDGLEATMHIRNEERLNPERPHCPIVAYTSGGTAYDIQLWEEIGIDAVLHKPTSLEKMAACLRQWCHPAFDGSALAAG